MALRPRVTPGLPLFGRQSHPELPSGRPLKNESMSSVDACRSCADTVSRGSGVTQSNQGPLRPSNGLQPSAPDLTSRSETSKLSSRGAVQTEAEQDTRNAQVGEAPRSGISVRAVRHDEHVQNPVDKEQGFRN